MGNGFGDGDGLERETGWGGRGLEEEDGLGEGDGLFWGREMGLGVGDGLGRWLMRCGGEK